MLLKFCKSGQKSLVIERIFAVVFSFKVLKYISKYSRHSQMITNIAKKSKKREKIFLIGKIVIYTFSDK